jgi:hypothetical protein
MVQKIPKIIDTTEPAAPIADGPLPGLTLLIDSSIIL